MWLFSKFINTVYELDKVKSIPMCSNAIKHKYSNRLVACSIFTLVLSNVVVFRLHCYIAGWLEAVNVWAKLNKQTQFAWRVTYWNAFLIWLNGHICWPCCLVFFEGHLQGSRSKPQRQSVAGDPGGPQRVGCWCDSLVTFRRQWGWDEPHSVQRNTPVVWNMNSNFVHLFDIVTE